MGSGSSFRVSTFWFLLSAIFAPPFVYISSESLLGEGIIFLGPLREGNRSFPSYLFRHRYRLEVPILKVIYKSTDMATTPEKATMPSSDPEKTPTMAEKSQAPQLMEINETGHVQELERNFSLFSICSVGIVTGNTWAALGGSIVIAIYNGGPPGVLYEFIAVSIFYWLIAASLAVSVSSSAIGKYPYLTSHAGTRLLDAVKCWSISLGIYHARPEIWSVDWMVCWMVEYLCVDVWNRYDQTPILSEPYLTMTSDNGKH